MSGQPILFDCDICQKPYQHGPHRYEGHRLHRYGDLMACDMCWQANHDGWNPRVEPILIASLQRSGLPEPERNESGLLPRE